MKIMCKVLLIINTVCMYIGRYSKVHWAAVLLAELT